MFGETVHEAWRGFATGHLEVAMRKVVEEGLDYRSEADAGGEGDEGKDGEAESI